MDAYIFQAELWCEKCAKAVEIEIEQSGKVPDHMGDPDQYPQGPYPQGGGEADSPQHCAGCGTFLENPLTTEGDYFVGSLLRDDECPPEWADFYSYLNEAPYV
jgi:hypothetical protein